MFEEAKRSLLVARVYFMMAVGKETWVTPRRLKNR
jgi:hypothetical protein